MANKAHGDDGSNSEVQRLLALLSKLPSDPFLDCIVSNGELEDLELEAMNRECVAAPPGASSIEPVD
jgi:hypothetical protein